MLLSTILELSAIPGAFGICGAVAYLLRSKPIPVAPLREYQPEDLAELAAANRYEFTDEQGRGLGELVPEGADPHSAVMERGLREGKTFGARAIKHGDVS